MTGFTGRGAWLVGAVSVAGPDPVAAGVPPTGLAATTLLVLALLCGVVDGVALADVLLLDAELLGVAPLELVTALLSTEVTATSGAVDESPGVGATMFRLRGTWNSVTANKLSAHAAPTTKLAKIPFAERLRLRSPLIAAHATTNE
jgi:hypothetical protein